MAITYTLGFDPFWYMADAYGRPLGNGGFYAASSLNPTIPKVVYQDDAGTIPYPTNTIITPGGGGVQNVILFTANGTQGPFYFKLDSSNPDDLYFIQFYDSQGNRLNTIDNYFPSGGGGGGGTIITNYYIKNYVVNNAFLHNNADPTTGLITATNGAVIAPSNHAGYRFPDIQFLRNNNSSTDTIKIVTPTTIGSDFVNGTCPLTNDETPEYYLTFQCTGAGAGVTQKCFQWPLDLHIKNLEQVPISILIWAKGISGTQTISPFIWQDTGSGGSPTVIAPVNFNGGPETLSGNWDAYLYTGTIASLAGITTGTCGDDATYLQIGMPLSNTSEISFTKPKVYLGTNVLTMFPEVQTYDDVDSVVMSPRTGDTRISLNSFSPYGWVPCNDGTIGNGSSGATRHNVDTWQLFNLIWTAFDGNQMLAPMFDSSGNPVSYGLTAVADFTANNRISLTKTLGRVLASVGTPSSGNNTGTNWALGKTTGNEEVTIATANLPSHTHDAPASGQFAVGGVAGSILISSLTPNAALESKTGDVTGLTNSAMNTQPPTTYLNVFLKL
jgi:hypothetical protein